MQSPWWKSGIIYQIYPRSFLDSDGDGVGDLKGLIGRLDYLAGAETSLGVDAIWLCPIHPSPLCDFGYDISDFKDIDPTYGTLNDFRELIAQCKKRNIKVILDLVVNHTSSDHPWFLNSASAQNSSKRDWYLWADGKGAEPPNNWRSRTGGSSWQFHAPTGQYYLHSFFKDQPDLNWRNAEVRSAVFEIMDFWLNEGVSGFRLDVFNYYFKDLELRNNPSRYSLRGLIYRYESQQHIYDKDRPELFGLVKEMRAVVEKHGDCILLGEVDSDRNAELAAECYGENSDGLNLTFNFDFLLTKWDALAFFKAIQNWEAHLPVNAWPTYVLSNHDQQRHFSRYGNRLDRARVAATMLLTLRGTPVMYYGEEIGMRESAVPFRKIKDPAGKIFWPVYKGRDGARTPMQWNGDEGAGFSTGTPWLPVDDSSEDCNVANAIHNDESLFWHYQKLIELRKMYDVLRNGSQKLLPDMHADVLCYLRESDETKMLVVLNFSDTRISFQTQWKNLRAVFGDGEAAEGIVQLASCSGTVFKV